MASKLLITVIGTPSVDDTLIFTTSISMRFSNVAGFGRIPISSDILTQVNNIRNKFNTDFNGFGQFDISILPSGVLEIIHGDDDYFLDASTSSSAIDVDFKNEVLEEATTAVVSVSPSQNPCATVTVTIKLNQNQDIINAIVGGQVIATESNTRELIVNVTRGSGGVNFKYTLGAGTNYTYQIVPDVLEITGVDINNIFFGSSANIYTNLPTGARYQIIQQTGSEIPTPNQNDYMLSSSRVGLVPSNYVAYVLDAFGCSTFQTFTTTDGDAYIRAPFYGYISPVNDFPFFKVANNFDGKNTNQDNRLTHEIPLKNQVSLSHYHSAWEGQAGKFQFKSSAEIVEAYVIDCDGNETLLPVEQKSDFIEADNILDGNYDVIAGLLRVSFTPGNRYGTNGDIIGEHNFNGTLPSYYQVGTILNVENIGIAPIETLVTNEGITYAIVSVDNPPAVEGTAKILSLHSIENYEVYEAMYDVTDIVTDTFSFAVKFENPDTELAYWRTNPIKKILSEDIENHHHIEYYGTTFNEINYSWSIKHKRYIPYNQLPIPITPESNIESYQTDTDVRKIDYLGSRLYAFNFKEMPNEIAISLVEAINSSIFLIIDGKPYVNKESAEMINIGHQVSGVKVNLTAAARSDLGLSFTPTANLAGTFYPIVP